MLHKSYLNSLIIKNDGYNGSIVAYPPGPYIDAPEKIHILNSSITQEEEIFTPIPLQDLREPDTPVSFSTILAKYHSKSVLHTKFSVFYAKVNKVCLGIKNVSHKKDLSLLQVYQLITAPTFEPETTQLRSITDDKQAKKYKSKHFCYACFSGTFSGRADDKLISHSKLICIDLDRLGNDLQRVRNLINSDPQTIMSFISPSGDGLKVIFYIDPEKYSQELYYRIISKYLSSEYSLGENDVDPSGKDVSRACFLPYDATAFLNLNFCEL